MLSLTTGHAPCRSEPVDIALPYPDGWRAAPFPMGGVAFAAIRFGHEAAGPMAALYSDRPRTEPMPSTPGHGHKSDSWRISIEGTLRMGVQRYGPGAFRFQQGWIPYGADDVSWGENGGYSIVMMADGRGSCAIAADPADQPQFDQAAGLFYDWLDMEKAEDYAEPASVATSLGPARHGRIDGSFEQPGDWVRFGPGWTGLVGLCGHRDVGPVIILSRVGDGGVAFPGITLPTEVMHCVVGGQALVDGRLLDKATVRVVPCAADGGAVTAAGGDLWLASVIGNRAALSAAKVRGGDEAGWTAIAREIARVGRLLDDHSAEPRTAAIG